MLVPHADVRPDAAFEQPRTHLQQLDAEEDKDDTAGSYAELMAALAQKVHSTPPPHPTPTPTPTPHPHPSTPSTPAPRGLKPTPFRLPFRARPSGDSSLWVGRGAEVKG